jgi:hypothetical protein
MRPILCTILLIAAVCTANAQTPCVRVLSYNDTAERIYFCGPHRLNDYLSFSMKIVNDCSDDGYHVLLDSLTYQCDTTVFKNLQHFRGDIGGSVSLSNFEYHPSKIGDDTLNVFAHWSADSVVSGMLVFHASQAPGFGLEGEVTTSLDIGDRFPGLSSNVLIKTDTIFDVISGLFWNDRVPRIVGPNQNTIRIISCSGLTIDSVTLDGDFSDIIIPSEDYPLILGSDSIFKVVYGFAPTAPGIHHPNLVYHVRGEKPLVWAFRYSVSAFKAVRSDREEHQFFVYPNPASEIINVHCGDYLRHLTLVNSCGIRLIDTDSPSQVNDYSIAIGHLPQGLYELIITSQGHTESQHVAIVR